MHSLNIVVLEFSLALALGAIAASNPGHCGSAKQAPAEAWIDVETGRIGASDLAEAKGPVIKGKLVDGLFQPSRTVVFAERASQAASPAWVPGWIELATGAIHSDVEGVAPRRPYLRGRLDEFRGFHVFPSELTSWHRATKDVAGPNP